jgi:hypothetical protein
MRAGRPFGVACVSDRRFDVRGTDGRFSELRPSLSERRGTEGGMSPTRDSISLLHAAAMRARPAAVLRKRHAALAADGFLVIRLGTAGRRVNPMVRRAHVVAVVASVGEGSRVCPASASSAESAQSARISPLGYDAPQLVELVYL